MQQPASEPQVIREKVATQMWPASLSIDSSRGARARARASRKERKISRERKRHSCARQKDRLTSRGLAFIVARFLRASLIERRKKDGYPRGTRAERVLLLPLPPPRLPLRWLRLVNHWYRGPMIYAARLLRDPRKGSANNRQGIFSGARARVSASRGALHASLHDANRKRDVSRL